MIRLKVKYISDGILVFPTGKDKSKSISNKKIENIIFSEDNFIEAIEGLERLIDKKNIEIQFNIEESYDYQESLDFIKKQSLKVYKHILSHTPSLKAITSNEAILNIPIVNARISDLFGSKFLDDYPKTISHIKLINQEIENTNRTQLWNNIGNSCRELLIIFTKELKELKQIELPVDIKSSDVKGTFKYIINKSGSGKRFENVLVNLISSIWDYIQPIIHRTNTTKQEALRAFIWTALLISEISLIIDHYTDRKN